MRLLIQVIMKMSSKQDPATVNRPNQKYLISLIAFVVFDIAVTMHKIVIELSIVIFTMREGEWLMNLQLGKH